MQRRPRLSSYTRQREGPRWVSWSGKGFGWAGGGGAGVSGGGSAGAGLFAAAASLKTEIKHATKFLVPNYSGIRYRTSYRLIVL